MNRPEVENRLLHEQWMSLTLEERLLTCSGTYEAERAILTSLATQGLFRAVC
jgi:hypothetical protein